MVVNIREYEAHPLLGAFYIWLAAVMWGTIGIFGKILIDSGLSPQMTGCVKLLGSSLILFVYFIFGKQKLLKIRWTDLSWLLAMAFLTQTAFNFTYHPVVELLGVSQAGVLLNTMPIFLTIWSVIFFKEHINMQKIIGIVLCLIGSILAITGGTLDVGSFSVEGVILGTISAISFSLMSVFTKILLKRIEPLTVIFYAFLFGGLMMVPFINFMDEFPLVLSPVPLASAFGLGLIGSVLPYIVYFKGIDLGVDLSKAGVISVMELISAIIMAMIIFNERLTGMKGIGVLIVIGAILLINWPSVDK